MADNIKVGIKLRPLIPKEKLENKSKLWVIENNGIREAAVQHGRYVFDYVFDEENKSDEIFDAMIKPIVDDCINGFNGSVMAYGQTSSGKTHVMLGSEEDPGIISLAVTEIFKEIQKHTNREFLVRCSYLEIYNEKINCLLDKNRTDLKIEEKSSGDFNIACAESIVSAEEDIYQLLEIGNSNRCVGATNMNERSSRSHTIFRVTVESREAGQTDAAVQVGVLNLVDLAGSERAEQAGTVGMRFKEGVNINLSLLKLSTVINQLSDENAAGSFVNYRDSKLTRVLQHSLGGNAKTAIICAVAPTFIDETKNTIQFAMRAKNVKNKPIKNEIMTDKAMIKRLQNQITKLQQQLEQEKTKSGGQDMRSIIEKIKDIQAQFILVSKSSNKHDDKTRRRTWAPGSVEFKVKSPGFGVADNIDSTSPLLMPPPSAFFTGIKNKHIATRLPTFTSDDLLADEEFVPAENVSFEPVSPSNSCHTPKCLRRRLSQIKEQSLSPRISETDWKNRCQQLESELEELQEFTKLEKLMHVHENVEVHTCEDEIASLTRDLQAAEQRNDELLKTISTMESQCGEQDTRLQEAENRAKEAEKARDAALKKQKYAEDTLNSIEFEFEAYKTKAKAREHDLVTKLEEIAQSADIDVIQNQNEQKEALEKELQAAQEMINHLKTELEQGQEKIRVFEASLAVMESYKEEINLKVQIIADLKERLQSTQDKIRDDQQAFEARDELAKEQNTVIEQLTTELALGKEKLQHLENQLTELTAQNGSLSDKAAVIDRFEEELGAEKQRLREALTELNDLRTINAELKQKVASVFVLERELNEEKERSNNLLSKVEELHAINSDLNLKMFNVENREQEMEVEKENMQRLREELAECQKKLEQVTKLETELSDAHQQLRILHVSLNDVKTENSQLIENLNAIKVEVNKAAKTPKNNLKSAIESIKHTMNKTVNSTFGADDLAVDFTFNSSINSTLNGSHDGTISNLDAKSPKKSTNSELEAQILRLSQTKLELESKLAEVSTESDKLSAQVENLFKDKVDLAQELTEARLKLEEQEVKSQHQMTELKSQIETLRQVNEEEINDLTATTETLLKTEEDLNRSVQAYKDQIECLRRENEQLRLKAAENVNESNKLTVAKAELLTQIAELRSTNTLEASELLVQDIERSFNETIEQSEEIQRSFDEAVQQIIPEITFLLKDDNKSNRASDFNGVHKRESDELKQVIVNLQLKHEQELIELQSQINSEQNSIEIQNLNEKIVKLEAEIADLQNQLSAKSSTNPENDLVIAELQKTRNELQLLTNEKLQLQKDNDELSTQIMEQVEENEAALSKLQAAEAKLSNLETLKRENEQTDQRLSALQTENEQLKQKLAADSSIISTVQQESEELREKLSQLMVVVQEKELIDTKISDLEGELKIREDQLMNEQNTIKSLQNALDSEKQSTCILSDNLARYKQELELLQDQHKQLKTDLAVEIQQLCLDRDESNRKLREESEKVLHYSKLIKSIEGQVEQFDLVVQVQSQKLVTSIEEKEQQIQNLQQRIIEFTEQKHKLRTHSNEQRSEITQLSEELVAIKNEKVVLADSLRQKENELLFQIEHTIPSLKQQVTDLTINCDKLQLQLNEAQNELETKDFDARKIVDIQQALSSEQDMVAELKAKLQRNLDKLEEYERQIVDYEEKLDSFESEKKDYELRRQNELKVYEKEVEEITEQFKALHEQKVQRDQELTELKAQVQSLSNEKAQLESKLKNQPNDDYESIKKSLEENENRIDYLLIKEEEMKQSIQVLESEKQKLDAELKKESRLLKEVTEQLHEMQKMHAFKTKQLEANHEASVKDKERMIQSLHEKIEQYSREREEDEKRAQEISNRNQCLKNELEELRRAKQQDRRSRRQSTHDNQRLSMHFTRAVHVQTDPSSDSCQCKTLVEKIQELKKQKAKLTCQIETHDLHTNMKLGEERAKVEEWMKRADAATNEALCYKKRVTELEMAVNARTRSCNVCQQRARIQKHSSSTQTDDCGTTDRIKQLTFELQQLTEKYEQIQKLAKMRSEKIKQLQVAANEKENNVVSPRLSILESENVQLKKKLDECEAKYSDLKDILNAKLDCNNRLKVEHETLLQKLAELQSFSNELNEKYEKVKSVSILRKQNVERLKRREAEIVAANKALAERLEKYELVENAN